MRPLIYLPIALTVVSLGQTTGRSVAFPNGTVEARGVCDVRPDSVACWDMDGKAAADLTDGVRAYLDNNGREVQFRLGKKNRYLVLRRPQALQAQYRIGPNNPVSANSTYNTEPVTDYVRIAVEPSETVATLTAQMTVQSKGDVDLALREGTKMDIEGRRVEVGAATKVVPVKGKPVVDPNNGYGNRPYLGDTWNVVLGVGGEGYFTWSYTPLDASGDAVRYVDESGKPIPALKALALEPNLQPNNGYYYNNANQPPITKKPKAASAFFTANGTPPAFRATTNIDPRFIATLRIRASHVESMDLGPFPLDPK